MDFREMVAWWYRSSPWRLCSSLTPIISIPVGRAMCILNVFALRRKLGLVISKAIVVVCSMHYQVFALSVLLSKLSSISHAGRSRSVESIPLNEYVFVRHRRTLRKCSRFRRQFGYYIGHRSCQKTHGSGRLLCNSPSLEGNPVSTGPDGRFRRRSRSRSGPCHV